MLVFIFRVRFRPNLSGTKLKAVDKMNIDKRRQGKPMTLITMINSDGNEGAFVLTSSYSETSPHELCQVYLIGLDGEEPSDLDAPLFRPLCRQEAVRAACQYARQRSWELTQIRCLRPREVEACQQ